MKFFYSSQKGITIVELIVSIAIAGMIVLGITSLARFIIRFNATAQSDLTAMMESRSILRVMVAELRSAIPSAQGAYPIESAGNNSIVFFADVNGDDIADRINYFLDPGTSSIKRGVVYATGSPPSYNLTSEKFSTLISGVLNDANFPVFKYYDGNYDGTTPSPPLPVSIQDIRLVKINITVNRHPNKNPPEIFTTSSNATLRNLKDNL